MKYIVIGNGEVENPKLKELIEGSKDCTSEAEETLDGYQLEQWNDREDDGYGKCWAVIIELDPEDVELLDDEQSVYTYADVEEKD